MTPCPWWPQKRAAPQTPSQVSGPTTPALQTHLRSHDPGPVDPVSGLRSHDPGPADWSQVPRPRPLRPRLRSQVSGPRSHDPGPADPTPSQVSGPTSPAPWTLSQVSGSSLQRGVSGSHTPRGSGQGIPCVSIWHLERSPGLRTARGARDPPHGGSHRLVSGGGSIS